MPSWCQSEASVRPLHLTDNAECVERTGEIVSVCGVWPGVITRPAGAWCVSAHCRTLCLTVCHGACVLASDPGPLLSHSQPARTALAVWRPEEPLPPLRRRPGSSLSLTWRCVGLLRVRPALGGRPHWEIDYWAPDLRCDNYRLTPPTPPSPGTPPSTLHTCPPGSSPCLTALMRSGG